MKMCDCLIVKDASFPDDSPYSFAGKKFNLNELTYMLRFRSLSIGTEVNKAGVEYVVAQWGETLALKVKDKKMSEWCKIQRAKLDLSQAQLAKESGVGKSTIGKIEACVLIPKETTLNKLESVLGRYEN